VDVARARWLSADVSDDRFQLSIEGFIGRSGYFTVDVEIGRWEPDGGVRYRIRRFHPTG
jgi:hypothetical protein